MNASPQLITTQVLGGVDSGIEFGDACWVANTSTIVLIPATHPNPVQWVST